MTYGATQNTQFSRQNERADQARDIGTSALGVSALLRTLTVTIVMLLDVPDLPDLLGTECARSLTEVSDMRNPQVTISLVRARPTVTQWIWRWFQ